MDAEGALKWFWQQCNLATMFSKIYLATKEITITSTADLATMYSLFIIHQQNHAASLDQITQIPYFFKFDLNYLIKIPEIPFFFVKKAIKINWQQHG